MFKKLALVVFFSFPVVSFAGYGSNFFTGGTASADSQLGGFEASDATDGNMATRWATNCPTGCFPTSWFYDLGSGNSKVLDKIEFYPEADGNGTQMKDFEILGSNDGVSYTSFYASSTTQGTTANVLRSYELATSTTAYRYFEINFINTNYVNNNYNPSVAEILAYEWEEVSTSTPTSTLTFDEEIRTYMLGVLMLLCVAYGVFLIASPKHG
jgi:hypothetical protein